jgi:hypothetical protein
MHYNRFGRKDANEMLSLQRKEEIAIFTPGAGKMLIKASYLREYGTAIETIGSSELTMLDLSGIVFIVGGNWW